MLWLATLAGCSGGGDPTATDPDLLFEDAFRSPRSEVEIVSEGGTRVQGLDAWLQLKPGLTGLKLRHPDRYALRACAEPLAWFGEVCGEKALLSDNGHFLCQESVDPRFPFDNGRWLVTDRSTGLAYYRIWKHYSKGGQ